MFLSSQVFFSFLETSVPLLVLIEAAKAGNEKEVEEYAQVFLEHANKLVEVNIYKEIKPKCKKRIIDIIKFLFPKKLQLKDLLNQHFICSSNK